MLSYFHLIFNMFKRNDFSFFVGQEAMQDLNLVLCPKADRFGDKFSVSVFSFIGLVLQNIQK